MRADGLGRSRSSAGKGIVSRLTLCPASGKASPYDFHLLQGLPGAMPP